MKALAPHARLLGMAGAMVWIVNTLQYGVAQIVVAAAWHTPYSWTRNYISDLGNTQCAPFAVHGTPTYVCSPLHTLMNASFVLSGVLTVLGTLLLWRVWPARRITTIALALWLVAGVLKMVVGLAPENTVAGLHLLGAANLPVLSVAIVLLGIAFLRLRPGFGTLSIVIGSVGLVGAILSTAAQTAGSALDLGLGNGGMERVAGYPGNVWMVIVGIGVLYTARSSDARVPPAIARRQLA
jgi:hypothetical membrane protein